MRDVDLAPLAGRGRIECSAAEYETLRELAAPVLRKQPLTHPSPREERGEGAD